MSKRVRAIHFEPIGRKCSAINGLMVNGQSTRKCKFTRNVSEVTCGNCLGVVRSQGVLVVKPVRTLPTLRYIAALAVVSATRDGDDYRIPADKIDALRAVLDRDLANEEAA